MPSEIRDGQHPPEDHAPRVSRWLQRRRTTTTQPDARDLYRRKAAMRRCFESVARSVPATPLEQSLGDVDALAGTDPEAVTSHENRCSGDAGVREETRRAV
jgi:hypothetical protein